MAKFSMLRDHEEEEDDEDYCHRSPKRRRTTFIPQSSISDQQQQQQQQQEPPPPSSSSEDDSIVGPTNSGGPISMILSDPDVLDCSICFNPLTIPVFQFGNVRNEEGKDWILKIPLLFVEVELWVVVGKKSEMCDNGHIACSSCCINLNNKCPSCCEKIGNNRCRAIEKVIESVQVSCCYSRYGCKETISYCKKHEHEEKCIYAPCSCPFPDCVFRGSPRRLSSHMCKEHDNLVKRFRYNSLFSVSLGRDEKIVVLLEERDGVLFILNHGNTVAIRCVDPSLSTGRFAYNLVLNTGGTSLKFQSFTRSITGKFNDPPSVDYILIPGYFYHGCRLAGLIKIEICIWSKDASHAAIC